MRTQLKMDNLSEDETAAASRALRGDGLALTLIHSAIRATTIRGIRRHIDYASSPKITALYTEDSGYDDADSTRARNTRLIKSNSEANKRR